MMTMTDNLAPWLGPIRQISFTTASLDQLMGFWETQVGIGPWTVFRGLRLNLSHEGRAISPPFDVALCMHGDMLFELIQVRGDGPSPFHDALGRPVIGLQRLAAFSQDFDADVQRAEAHGMEHFAQGRDATGQRYSYFRSAAAPGVLLELLELTPAFAGFVDALQARARRYGAPQPLSTPSMKASSMPDTPTPSSMHAAQLRAYGDVDQFELAQVPVPQPGPGQIRVRVAAAAINPVDVKARKGWLKDWMPMSFPAQLGGDVAGIVDAVGEGVSDFQPGDRVMGMLNPLSDGAYAEYVVFHAAQFAQVPDGMDLAEAAALPTGGLTGTQLVEIGVAPRQGMKGLVTGAGGSTGRAAVLAALDAGAQVYAGVRKGSEALVADLPVAGVIDLSDPAALAAAGPFDFIADTVGGAVAEQLFAYVRPDGVVASTAFPPPAAPAGSTQRSTSLIVHFDGPRLQRFARERMRQHPMPIARRFALAEVADAHRLMEQGGVGGKIVLIP
ncbi:hypothetical protein GCM10027082_10020 [Comamonas humi]